MVTRMQAGEGVTHGVQGFGRGRARIGRRPLVAWTIIAALLAALVASVAASRASRSDPALVEQAQVIQQDPGADAYSMLCDAAFCPGDCQLGRAGGTDPIGAIIVSPSTASYTFPAVYGNDEASTMRQRGGPARPGAGVGPVERRPGEEAASPLPAPAPERQAPPLLGPQP